MEHLQELMVVQPRLLLPLLLLLLLLLLLPLLLLQLLPTPKEETLRFALHF